MSLYECRDSKPLGKYNEGVLRTKKNLRLRFELTKKGGAQVL